MFCTQCGSELTENDKFCPNCGAKNRALDVKVTEEAEAEEAKAEEAEAEEVKAEEAEAEEAKAEEAEAEEAKAEEAKAEETKAEEAEAEEVKAEEVKAEEAKAEEAKAEEAKAEEAEAEEAETEETIEEKLHEAGETAKEKINEAVDSAKKAGENFAASDAVQNAKKEMHDIIDEAKAASERQAGQADENTAVPRESVSFLVDWFYWTGRRSRLKYLWVGCVTSICSLALGSTGILSLLFCYVSAVNLVKRLHDVDKPGWYAFLLMAAEYIIICLTWLFGLVGLGVAAAGVTSGLFLWLIPLMLVWAIKLWVFFIPGTKGPNKYGPESL